MSENPYKKMYLISEDEYMATLSTNKTWASGTPWEVKKQSDIAFHDEQNLKPAEKPDEVLSRFRCQLRSLIQRNLCYSDNERHGCVKIVAKISIWIVMSALHIRHTLSLRHFPGREVHAGKCDQHQQRA